MPKGKNKTLFGLMKDKLSGKIMKEFAALRAKSYSYLTDNNNEDKNPKGTKTCVVKIKLKFEDYRHFLEATQLENKINNLEKNNLNVDNIRENHNEFIKNNKLILKLQQRFWSKKHNVFTEEVNKIALSANRNLCIWNKQRSSKWKRRH